MPGTSGIDAIAHIRRQHPEIKLVALTFHKEDRYIHSTLEAGANAYVLKDDSRTELFTALNSVLQGKSYLSPSICDRVVAGYLGGGDEARQEPRHQHQDRREAPDQPDAQARPAQRVGSDLIRYPERAGLAVGRRSTLAMSHESSCPDSCLSALKSGRRCTRRARAYW